ncbi:hypothetical protein GC170_03545 [bacterium]|nr:hypothetical protein [bacterium]
MKWQALNYNYMMATVESGESIEPAMAEFCQQIKDYVIPRNDGIAWDYLRVEFWPDSGRMIAFPSSNSISGRIEQAGCLVVFARLRLQYERLADSELEDQEFVAALHEAERDWITTFLDAARQVSLTGYRFQFWDGDGESPIWNGCL